jgi:hypothetical protein
MVLDFGLIKSDLFPQSAAIGQGVAASDTARVDNEAGEPMTVLGEDATRKWAIILAG